jgi:hypothetical protein
MSTENKPLPEKKVVSIRQRKKNLESMLKSQTIYEMFDPPLKSKEEIEQLKKQWKEELDLITKVLKENTLKKRRETLAKGKSNGYSKRKSKVVYIAEDEDEEE